MKISLFDTTEKFKRKYLPLVQKINTLEEDISSLSDDELRSKTDEFKSRFNRGESLEELLPEAFSVVREASKRTLGLRHFDVQLFGGIALFLGKIAEMKTGEGKTLVATLPAYLEAISNNTTHIVTVNEYLVKRDAEWMGSIYKFLGLTVSYVLHDMDFPERKKAYNSDVMYCTNSEVGFDYLRDNMAHSRDYCVQKELNYAIVDEVDSILIDEARTPLIISGPAERATDLYYKADKAVRGLILNEDFTVDEKTKSVSILEQGIHKLEAILSIPNLYASENVDILRHLNQALRARHCFKNEVDYIAKDGEIVIVDEFTGRLLFGRRYSDGLHQAIEAKEGLRVKEENQTLATITFQNFFRMYKKLAGMTGTAKTEENEFREIYGLEVIVIPTNKPVVRKDHPDIVYKTENVKFRKIVDDIVNSHKKGQPVLVGTRSIEKSERISKMLKKEGIPHEVLNAKYHEREAEIIKKAGERGAVTIATNMAGRGVDIVLGNSVTDLGGLYVIGTERHESRRIDNQLRGRSGRQGDPGQSRFYLSLDDELLRIFGGERIGRIFESLSIDENMPLESSLLTRAIENAQKRVENYNFDIRKTLLEYDNVLNKQREIIYNERNKVLDSTDIKDHIMDMLMEVSSGIAHRGLNSENRFEVNLDEVNKGIYEITGLNIPFKDQNEVGFKELDKIIFEKLKSAYEEKESSIGPENMREIERHILLYIVDSKWKDHLYNMDHLKEGIGLRGYGQQDPLVQYQIEGFQMFEDMLASIKEETISLLFKVRIQKDESSSTNTGKKVNSNNKNSGNNKPKLEINKSVTAPNVSDNVKKKIGRNDPCPCGSGKKYKKCCGKGL
ncbi:MAG: preprotein translocase subunit SecA [Caldisericia bacterium]|nr:preprotein translocase subunit SecA [Caldisericia bacterium]